MTLSQQAMEDVEALCLGSSFLMADPLRPRLYQDEDEDEALSPSSSLKGKVPPSPSLSFSFTPSPPPYETLSSPSSSVSPPPSPPTTFLGTKARVDSLSFPWPSGLLDSHVGADNGKDDAFVDMEWMTEKIDLSEFDLDSLIDSCSSDESPSSPEDLLASLDSHMDLELDSFGATILVLQDGLELPSIPPLPLEPPLPAVEVEVKKTEAAPHEEMVLKSEPPSPMPSPSPPSPAYTLELGSEVDVLDVEKTAPSPLSDQSGAISPPPSDCDCDSDSGIESVDSSPTRHPSPPLAPSPAAGSSRTKPYSRAEPPAAISSSARTSRIKSASGAPKVVEKKLKKMEQNKTAATRYRQKKRVEQERLGSELEGLKKRNRELTEKAESISREIQYLKDLMEEVRKHRLGKSGSVA